MDLSTGGNLDECREAIIRESTVPIGTVPIYSMIIGRTIEELSYDFDLEGAGEAGEAGGGLFHDPRGGLQRAFAVRAEAVDRDRFARGVAAWRSG
jgi:hypothetical protein